MRFRTPAARRSTASVVVAVVLAVAGGVLMPLAPLGTVAPAAASVVDPSAPAGAPQPTASRSGMLAVGGPEAEVPTPYVHWTVTAASGSLVGGAAFELRNDGANPISVADCSAAPCVGRDVDPDPGEFQVTGLVNSGKYSVHPIGPPAGHVFENPAPQSGNGAIGNKALGLPGFIVLRSAPVTHPALACVASTFYSVSASGEVSQIVNNGGTDSAAVTRFGSWPTATGGVNALGINAGGTAMYALQQGSSNSVAAILRYSVASGWESLANTAYQTGNSGALVAGAVNPVNGLYYFGGYHTAGAQLQFRLHVFNPTTGVSSLVGAFDTGFGAGTAAYGDMAFDGAGNLTVVRGGTTINVYTVTAASLSAPSDGTLARTVTNENALTGMAEVNGIAFDFDGNVYLGNQTNVRRYNPTTWAQSGPSVTSSIVGSADLASCNVPPTFTLRTVVDGRVVASDQFRTAVSSGTVEAASVTTSGTGTGLQAQQIGPIPVVTGSTIRISETMASGVAADYASSYACTVDGAALAQSAGTSGDIVIPPGRGASVVCTFTSTPLVTTVVIHKTVQDASGTNPQPGAGWMLTAAASPQSGTLTSAPAASTQSAGSDGSARWSLRHSALTTVASIAVSETQQAGHAFVSGTCTVTPRGGTATVVALPSASGATLHDVQPGSAVVCEIVNRIRPTTLTLVAEVGFGNAPAASWQLTATGPQGALAGPSGVSGTTGPVTPARAYRLSQSGGPATYTQVGGWTCVDQAGSTVPVSAQGDVTAALGDQVTCKVINATAALVLLERVVGSTSLTPGQFTLTATPAQRPGLAPSTVVGADAVTTANTAIVRPDHAYTLSSASEALHITGKLERYLGTVQPDGAVDHATAALWQQVDPATVTVSAGQTAVYRFTATAPTPLILPLTGGVGADAYLFGGGALLLLAAALLVLARVRRPRAQLMTTPNRITPRRSLASLQEGTATMASTKKSLTTRVAAGFGAAALATLTVLGGALPASAAPDNIQAGQLGSITVHKFAEPATGTGLDSDGTVVDTTGLTALDGVEFTVEHVTGIDLTTDAGWAAAAALTPATVVEDDLELIDAIETSATGAAVFEALPIGVYLVTETDPGDHGIAIETAPFLVSIPMAADNGWLYDVNVYPKNSLTSIEKSVDDSAARGLGDEVTWTIKVDVPEIASDDTLDEFRITDTLDTRLTLVDAALVLTVPGTNPDDPRQEVALTYGTHFTATETSNYVVEFTLDGRRLLAGLDQAEIVIEGVTTVRELGDGIIQNVASVTVNGTTFSTTPVETSWGTLAILKHVTGDTARVLAGAEFQVFATEADATARANPISVDGETTFTTLENGIAFVPGLKAGDYWIVEMQAPAGYQIVQTPIDVTVDAGDVTETSVDVEVANALIPAYALPITGGSGQAAFMIGGFGLLAGAMGFALLRRRKAQQDA